jgi:hypothetical protein
MMISKSRFAMIVSNLSKTNSPTMNPPLFIFKMCHAAAVYNAKVLADHNFNLNTIIEKQHPSQISYGSKFCHPDLLEELLFHHPYWPRLKSIFLNGAFFPLEDISDSDHDQDLVFHSSHGNHKSASKTLRFYEALSSRILKGGLRFHSQLLLYISSQMRR